MSTSMIIDELFFVEKNISQLKMQTHMCITNCTWSNFSFFFPRFFLLLLSLDIFVTWSIFFCSHIFSDRDRFVTQKLWRYNILFFSSLYNEASEWIHFFRTRNFQKRLVIKAMRVERKIYLSEIHKSTDFITFEERKFLWQLRNRQRKKKLECLSQILIL